MLRSRPRHSCRGGSGTARPRGISLALHPTFPSLSPNDFDTIPTRICRYTHAPIEDSIHSHACCSPPLLQSLLAAAEAPPRLPRLQLPRPTPPQHPSLSLSPRPQPRRLQPPHLPPPRLLVQLPFPLHEPLLPQLRRKPTKWSRSNFPPGLKNPPRWRITLRLPRIVAVANLVSIDTEILEIEKGQDYWVDLLYVFRVDEYLKGGGSNELVVVENSGRKHDLDIIYYRSREDAVELADRWLQERKIMASGKEEAIIFVEPPTSQGQYKFTGRYLSYLPIVGTAWLPKVGDSGQPEYEHRLTDDKTENIGLSGLRQRIEELRPVLEGEYAECATQALSNRDGVRDQRLGTRKDTDWKGAWGGPTSIFKVRTFL